MSEIKTSNRTAQSRMPSGPRPLRYGLPCSGCRLYYEAQLNACPVCNCATRVEPAMERPRSAIGSF
jgi:hypothetical protein